MNAPTDESLTDEALHRDFEIVALTLPCLPDPAVAIAVCRAGGIGVLDLEWSAPNEALPAVQRLVRLAKGRWGIKLDGEDEGGCAAMMACVPQPVEVVILTEAPHAVLARQIARLQAAPFRPKRIVLEVTDGRAIAQIPGIDGLIAKGHEAGGIVGDETSFILLQRLVKQIRLPVWVQGGIGLHTVAACRAAGATGVVLDVQLSLTRESALTQQVRQAITRMDGSETVACSDAGGRLFRSYQHSGGSAIKAMQVETQQLDESQGRQCGRWKSAVAARLSWSQENSVWPLGQDAGMALRVAQRFLTTGSVVSAFREAAESHVQSASKSRPLAEGAPLAISHGTRFPIVQGPMTRVSDNAAFAAAVAEGGALPFVALALSSKEETRRILTETRAALGQRPWGVGILGFVSQAVRAQQLEVIKEIRPTFALIAGGRPDQALSLDREGIATYLHIPSPDLLRLFFEQGARRFVFEGRECGGHVGPRSSFVLWDAMIEALLSLESNGADLSNVHLLFAGGVHDALSASMVGAMAAPLAAAGVKIGVLLGTAYLFTREIVATGAIVPAFQDEVIRCTSTALLESGAGHASRCARTPFVAAFETERRRLVAAGTPSDETRGALEELSLGRLRLATKGLARQGTNGSGERPKLVPVGSEEQRSKGMYMLGQLAALREELCSIEDLHRDVSVNGSARLAGAEAPRSRRRAPRPCNVAIIGVGALLPGASNARQFWQNILAKVDAITEIPLHRFDWRQYFDPDPAVPDKIYSRWGGFLQDVIFDPTRYGMPPYALASIEPMQLLTLEVVRAAIADAGYGDRSLARAATSVILGAGGGLADLGQQYGMRSGLPGLANGSERVPAHFLEALPTWTEDSFAGLLLNVAAGRVANRFDLGGVNFTVDAACASSLAAIYSGVRELQAGSSDVVISGGIDTVQNPFGYLCFSKTKALSAQGRCKSFDADADGTVISEGLAVLVLKRLADAERDGDRIYAVIKSIAGSSDGRDKGLTAPRPEGQLAALRRAYETAGVSPTTVGLIEAHGTGTAAGDVAEVEALKRAFTGASRQRCALGSVKSMIGHTKCAAGAAGLIKAAMALHDKVLPPTLHVKSPNPKADFAGSPFFINTEARPWIAPSTAEPRRAGVSAFGFGGTNFHVVLEEYTDDPVPVRAPIARNWPNELLVWSAPEVEGLHGTIAKVLRSLELDPQQSLARLGYVSWQEFRHAHGIRAAVIADNVADLQAKLTRLQAHLAGSAHELTDPRGVYLGPAPSDSGRGQVAFLFPGQGSQHLDMLSDLAIHFPDVRDCLSEADRLLLRWIPEGISSHIFPPSRFSDEETARYTRVLNQTELTQPAMGAACTAMLRLLQSMGVCADVVAGHSYGEYVALAAAGMLSIETLYGLSAARGRCIAEAADGGAMLAVFAGQNQVAELIERIGDLWIANFNSPAQTVLSGTPQSIAAARELCCKQDIECRPVPVSCAFHSPLVARPKDKLAAVLAEASLLPPRLPVFSNTTGQRFPDDPAAVAALLSEHLVRPVRFMDEVEAMYRSGVRTFVEVGPRNVLTGLVGQILEGRPHLAVAACGVRSSLREFLCALAQLLIGGLRLSLSGMYQGRFDPTEARDEPPPVAAATAWLVNGGRARRWGEPAMRSPPAASALPSVSPPANVPQPPVIAPVAGDSVLTRFQETMTQFIEVQRQTMLAYLNARKSVSPDEVSAPGASPAPPAKRVDAAVRENAPQTASLPVAQSPCAVAVSPEDSPQRPAVTARLRAIVSERTGYPVEMLDPTLNLEADLGIDSIKRTEILGTFQRGCDSEARQKVRSAMEKLTALKTIGSLSTALEGLLGETSGEPVDAATLRSEDKLPEPGPTLMATHIESAPRERVPRFVLRAVAAPAVSLDTPALPKGLVLITDDGGGVGMQLAAELGARGWPTVMAYPPDHPRPNTQTETAQTCCVDLTNPADVAQLLEQSRKRYGRLVGIIHLLPLSRRIPTWQQRLALETRALFLLSRAAAADLRAHRDPRAILLSATCLGGDFGVSASRAPLYPTQGGVAGLIKTLALEWPEVTCRALDFEPDADAAGIVQRLLTELSSVDPAAVEVGYQGTERLSLRITPAALGTLTPPHEGVLDKNPIILATGGLRGITAKATLALASKYGGTIVAVGKSSTATEEESPSTSSLSGARELRNALIERARRAGTSADPAAIEAEHREIIREREMRANLRALRSTGAEVHYVQCDVANQPEFAQLLQTLYLRYGAIHVVLHGAGIIEDRLVADKTPESFDRVLATKVNSAMVLAENLRPDTLCCLAFFSSVSARFGNRGQADYAAANEVLNKLATHLQARWPAARVVAINWGPWDHSNMVSGAVRDQFARRGVQLIDPSEGCRAWVDELVAGRIGDTEVILGGGPWGRGSDAESSENPLLGPDLVAESSGGGLTVRTIIDPWRHAYLEDHCLDGKPVLPAAFAVEFMAEIARQGWPDRVVTGVRAVRLLTGIVLDEPGVSGPNRTIRISARPQTHHSAHARDLAVDVELADPEHPSTVYYRGVVNLAYDLPAAVRPEPRNFVPECHSPLTVEAAYQDHLFHGPRFRCLTQIMAVSEAGIRAQLRPSRPCELMRSPSRGSWIIDPVLLDAGPQLLILWARHMRGVTALPSRFGEIQIYAGLAAALCTGASEPLECRLCINTDDEPLISADFEVLGPGGMIVLSAAGLESTCSAALNRLAGATQLARRTRGLAG